MKRLAFLFILISACNTAPATGSGPAVALSEFAVDASGLFSVGPNDVAVTNDGEFGHTFVVSDATGRVVDATNVIGPGEQTNAVIDLEPGEYEFSCRIVVQTGDGTLVDHYHEGMVTTVEVAGAP